MIKYYQLQRYKESSKLPNISTIISDLHWFQHYSAHCNQILFHFNAGLGYFSNSSLSRLLASSNGLSSVFCSSEL